MLRPQWRGVVRATNRYEDKTLAQTGFIGSTDRQARLDAKRDLRVAIGTVVARCGQIMDTSIVPVPRPRDSRDENRSGKTGEVPLND